MARRTIILTPEEIEAVRLVVGSPLARRFDMDERAVMRYALRHCREIFDAFGIQQSEITATKHAVQALSGKVEEALDKVIELAKETRGRPKRLNVKLTEEELYDEGRLICEELGGILQGNTCIYKKYEIASNKRPYETEIGLGLSVLNQRMLEEQYSPSKKEYDAAVIKYNV